MQGILVEYDEKPLHETYVVPTTIKPDDGLHLFIYIGNFLAYIAPHNLTIGEWKMRSMPLRHRIATLNDNDHKNLAYSAVTCMLEMLRDVFQSRVTLVQLILEVRHSVVSNSNPSVD